MESKFDLNANLNFLIDTKVDLSNVKEQSKSLDSNKHNDTFQAIEDSLNLLYEKTRTMQNTIDYANSFIKNEIDETIAECKTLLSNIENNRDVMKDSAYINYNVKLQSIFDTYSDRDNTPIKGVEMHNGVITLNNNIIEDVILDNSTLESRYKNYNVFNTLDEISTDKNYRTMYMFDRTQKDSIKEKIVMHFSKIRTINKVNFIPSNCIITSIEYTYADGSIEAVEGYEINLTKNRNVKTVAINIECKNYIISNIDYKNTDEKVFWEGIENEEVDMNKDKYYYYLFGLDKISIQYVEPSNKSCFISKEIKIEELKENEYLALTSDYSCEKGSIEFYIIDGTNEIPILPEGETTVIEEKIFYKTATRFTVDDITSIKMYQDNIPSKVSLNEAINSTTEGYTATYIPKAATSITSTLNNTIKVKAIIRNYDSNYIPYIKSIQIKKYGGDTLWTDNLQI